MVSPASVGHGRVHPTPCTVTMQIALFCNFSANFLGKAWGILTIENSRTHYMEQPVSVIIGSKVYSNPTTLRTKIQEASNNVAQTQGMVDYIELMADGYLALDNTALDENKKKNQVTFMDEGVYVNAERSSSGELKSFEMIDESGDQPKTLKKSIQDGLATYEISMGGQTINICEDANGTLVFDLAK